MDKKNINYQDRMLGHYEKLSSKDQERLRKDVLLLEKIVDDSEVDKMIIQRIESYNNPYVNKSLVNGEKDLFDFYSDFYSVARKDGGDISIGIRVTTRSKLGILQSELNLMDIAELKEFYLKQGINLKDSSLKKSTMENSGKKRLSNFLKQYRHDIWEVGGFFGECRRANFSKLLLGIGQLGFLNNWNLAIQTQTPIHASYFLRGFPYKIIANSSVETKEKGYKDSMGRPAVTLGLTVHEFKSPWEGFLKEIRGKGKVYCGRKIKKIT